MIRYSISDLDKHHWFIWKKILQIHSWAVHATVTVPHLTLNHLHNSLVVEFILFGSSAVHNHI